MSDRHHDATHYDPNFFDTSSAGIFPGTALTDRQQARRVA
jgi:hypothetical protein